MTVRKKLTGVSELTNKELIAAIRIYAPTDKWRHAIWLEMADRLEKMRTAADYKDGTWHLDPKLFIEEEIPADDQ